jgi:hypothetical protein
MKNFLRKPVYVFFLVAVLVAGILLLFPIPLFDGENAYIVGGNLYTEQTKMHLMQINSFGINEAALKKINDPYLIYRYLNTKGYMMLGLMTIGLPLLIAYRVHIGNQRKAAN